MCILFIALKQHPKYPLIVCANRDEFHHRPTEQAHFWMPENQMLAGKDLQAGGSWLGINRQGNFAALTNFRQPQAQQDGMKSRGELILNALKPQDPITTAWLREHSQNYNPFNLVFGHRDELYCYRSTDKTLTPLTAGFHSISNGDLDDIWPKMARGTQALEQVISESDEPDIEALLAIMKDETRAEESELPQTGIALEWERLLSSIYIRHREYGTRSTSIILQDHQGHTRFIEVRYDGKGRHLGQQEFNLRK
jgi:uncharacterized protein with NRDE domain